MTESKRYIAQTEPNLYVPERDLEKLEPHYSRHVTAMTSEDLRSKSAIAAELAARDRRIEELEYDRNCLQAELKNQSAELHADLKESYDSMTAMLIGYLMYRCGRKSLVIDQREIEGVMCEIQVEERIKDGHIATYRVFTGGKAARKKC